MKQFKRAVGTTPELEAFLQKLEQYFAYDPTTGNIIVIKYRGGTAPLVGSVAGSISLIHGYRYVQFERKHYGISRLVWLFTHGKWPTYEINFLDGDKLNTKLENLRDVPHVVSHRNKRKLSNNTSGVTGVHWVSSANLWSARVMHDGKYVFSKRFASKDRAAQARAAFIKAHPELKYTARHGK